MKIICWINLIFLFTNTFVSGQSFESEVTSNGYYLRDENSLISYDSIIKIGSEEFTAFGEKQKVKIGYNSNDAVWAKIIIQNNSGKPISKWIVFNNIHLDSVELFYHDKYAIQGDRTAGKEALCIAPAFDLQLDTGTNQIYIRIKKISSFLNFEYEITTPQKYLPIFHFRLSGEAFAIGILFLFAVFNTFFFIASKNRLYLYYSLYACTTTIYLAVNTGFLKFILFPDFLYFSEFRIYSSFISGTFLALFIMRYLDFEENKKRLSKFIHFFNLVNIIAIFVSFIPYLLKYEWWLKITILGAYLNVFVMFMFLLGGIVASLKSQRNKSLYVLSVFIGFFVWGMSFLLREFTHLRLNFAMDWLTFCAIYEAMLFGVLLAVKYYSTFKENNALMKDIIIERENSLIAFSKGETEERQRLSNTLHDNFGSRLTAILLFVDQQAISKVKEELLALAKDIRDLSHRIMPRSLREGALTAALEKHIQTQNEANKTLYIEFYQYDFPEKINHTWIYDIYLISQEIINNVIKHSKATILTIEFFGYDEEYIFQFTDNGSGFNKESVIKGSGLENIELRIKKHNGKVEINSFENEGTHIIIQIPKV